MKKSGVYESTNSFVHSTQRSKAEVSRALSNHHLKSENNRSERGDNMIGKNESVESVMFKSQYSIKASEKKSVN
jgi:hypothetical protein